MSKKRSHHQQAAASERARARQIAARGATAALRAVGEPGVRGVDARLDQPLPPLHQRRAVADDEFRERAGLPPRVPQPVPLVDPGWTRAESNARRAAEAASVRPYEIALKDAISVTRQVVQNLHAEADRLPWHALGRRREIRAKAHDQFIALGVMERVQRRIEDSLR